MQKPGTRPGFELIHYLYYMGLTITRRQVYGVCFVIDEGLMGLTGIVKGMAARGQVIRQILRF
jgi:hypothetical protein